MDETANSDETLAKRAQEGDLEAFGELVKRYQTKLLGYGRRFLSSGEDVEDAVQEAFIRAYQNLASFNVQRRFSPWIYRIAHNAFVSIIRKNSRQPFLFFDPETLFPHPAHDERMEEKIDRHALIQQLDKHLHELDAKYREALVLRYYEELSYADIASILHVPVGTVSIRLKRGREKLNKHLYHKP